MHIKIDGLSIIIINPELGSRSRLREALKSCVYNVKLEVSQTVKETIDRFDLQEECDLIMISHSMGEDSINELIKDASEKYGKIAPSFIVTLEKVSHSTMGNVTSMYLQGIAGFIAEPYSVNELHSLLMTVYEHRQQIDDDIRIRKALKFVINEAVRHVHTLAEALRFVKNGLPAPLKELRKLNPTLENLYSQDPELYAEFITHIFSNIEPPSPNLSALRHKNKQKAVKHPGVEVTQIMEQRGLTVERLSSSLKVELGIFLLFLEGKESIDEVLASDLSRLFGKTPREWAQMQREYDFYRECQMAKAERYT